MPNKKERSDRVRIKGRKYISIIVTMIFLLSLFPGYGLAEETGGQNLLPVTESMLSELDLTNADIMNGSPEDPRGDGGIEDPDQSQEELLNDPPNDPTNDPPSAPPSDLPLNPPWQQDAEPLVEQLVEPLASPAAASYTVCYELADGTKLLPDKLVEAAVQPVIAPRMPVSLTAEVEGTLITVSADYGVIPEGTVLSARRLSDDEMRSYLEALESSQGITLNQSMAFDITLLDTLGNEIQPAGEVEVSFSNVTFAATSEELRVYHFEPVEKITKAKSLADIRGKDGAVKNFKIIDKLAGLRGSKVIFNTEHFSIYLVGTTNFSATYNFYVGADLVDTQIIVNSGELVAPETPDAQPGQRFTGWYVEGTTEPLVFGTPLTVSATETKTVNAVFGDVFYVYFVYDSLPDDGIDGDVIAT